MLHWVVTMPVTSWAVLGSSRVNAWVGRPPSAQGLEGAAVLLTWPRHDPGGEKRHAMCPVRDQKLISICRQPMLIAATRCYLIQMLRSALTCANGCSCWSPGEENSPRIFLTMDALYRLS
jgi:hypothetical protein